MSDFFKTIRGFLLDYLPNQRNYSANTIKSYKYAIKMFVDWLRKERHLSIRDINFTIIDVKLLIDFLDWCQNVRGISAASRNHRIAVIHSFLSYAADQDVALISLYRDVVDRIKTKKSTGRIVLFKSGFYKLSDDAVESVTDITAHRAFGVTVFRHRLFSFVHKSEKIIRVG